ncbi:MAG: IPT/TIG domain-containing protein, partial [Bacteroidota bacterium]
MKRFIFLFALVWLVLTSHSTFSQNQNVIKDKILSGNIKFKNLDKGELCTSNIYTIEWEGIPANDTVRIEYSTNGGVDWILITNSATGLKYDWSVPETPCLNCTARIITKDVDNPFQIISVNPNKGLVGDEITISGIGFGSSQGTSIVSFSGANATQYISWSDTQIKVKVPTGAVTGTVFITVNGKKSNEVAFAIEANPIILTSINPNSAKIGDAVTLTGNGFGSNRGSNYVSFNGTNATEYTNWSDTQIVCKVPNGAPSGQVTVTVDGSSSNGVM